MGGQDRNSFRRDTRQTDTIRPTEAKAAAALQPTAPALNESDDRRSNLNPNSLTSQLNAHLLAGGEEDAAVGARVLAEDLLLEAHQPVLGFGGGLWLVGW